MSSNRFPDGFSDNNENEKEHVFITSEDGALCDHCIFQRKCHKYITIMQTLQLLEMTMFKDFTINLDTIALVTHCPTFVPDPMDQVIFKEEDE